jgi:hypothetical protein
MKKINKQILFVILGIILLNTLKSWASDSLDPLNSAVNKLINDLNYQISATNTSANAALLSTSLQAATAMQPMIASIDLTNLDQTIISSLNTSAQTIWQSIYQATLSTTPDNKPSDLNNSPLYYLITDLNNINTALNNISQTTISQNPLLFVQQLQMQMASLVANMVNVSAIGSDYDNFLANVNNNIFISGIIQLGQVTTLTDDQITAIQNNASSISDALNNLNSLGQNGLQLLLNQNSTGTPPYFITRSLGAPSVNNIRYNNMLITIQNIIIACTNITNLLQAYQNNQTQLPTIAPLNAMPTQTNSIGGSVATASTATASVANASTTTASTDTASTATASTATASTTTASTATASESTASSATESSATSTSTEMIDSGLTKQLAVLNQNMTPVNNLGPDFMNYTTAINNNPLISGIVSGTPLNNESLFTTAITTEGFTDSANPNTSPTAIDDLIWNLQQLISPTAGVAQGSKWSKNPTKPVQANMQLAVSAAKSLLTMLQAYKTSAKIA